MGHYKVMTEKLNYQFSSANFIALAINTILCQNCRGNFPESAWILHESTCERHRWYCKECDEVIPKSDREKHHQNFHCIVSCIDCDEEMQISSMANHKKNKCPHRLVKCMYCNCDVFYCNFEEHEYVCGSRTDQCENCKKYIQLCQLPTHICESIPEITHEEYPVVTNKPVSDDIMICPFCMCPATDYSQLQEHIFEEHPETI